MRKKLNFFTLFLALSIFAIAQGDDFGKAGIADVADSDPGLFIFMMLLLFSFAGVFVAGMIITLLLFAIFSLLVFSGIVSASLMTAWYKKSLSKGIRLFLFLIFGICGSCFGVFTLLIFKMIWFQNLTLSIIITAGILMGIAGGLATGWLIFKTLRLGYDFIISRLNYKQNKLP